MKSLELGGLNLQELNFKELVSIEGGNALFRGIRNLGRALYIAGQDFVDGFNSVKC